MTLSKYSRKGTVVCMLAAALLCPAVAHAGIGDILSLFQAITATVSGAIGPALADIQAVEARLHQLEQQVVWPEALIAQARSSVQQLRAQFTAAAGQIRSFRLNSATLAAPSQLEKLLRASQTSQFDQIANSYQAVFQPLPAPQSATTAQRALVDMDDATALSALKTATAADAAGASQLAWAEAIEQQTAGAAPGSAPLLAAQAQISQLQSQAMLHKLLAAQLRQEAALLAHDNALRKQGAASLHELRGNMLRILGRH
jgi:hypothetical protein